MEVNFLLLREGSSDDPFVAHLRALLVDCGASGAEGNALPFGGTVLSKLGRALEEGPEVDLLFVHRDSDARDPAPRFEEILHAAGALQVAHKVVPLVPVRMTESWLLADEEAIRAVAGKPSSTHPIGLPAPRAVETVAHAKDVLAEALAAASLESGARLKRVRRKFDQQRATLLARLDRGGPVARLTSWQRLVADIEAAMLRLEEAEASRAVPDDAATGTS